MCRIAGITFNLQHADAIDAMTDAQAYGGPDDRGIYRDDTVALGHRRLAIHDLTPCGHQPMTSPSGRYIIVHNGEIYNFKALRTELIERGYQFKSESDTEVMLCAIEAFGFKTALDKFEGMFAFALWDKHTKKLYLARDRFGEKPLYYALVNGALIFASELKALRLYPGFPKYIDREALQYLLRYAYIPAPLSIYQDVSKLQPAHYLEIGQDLVIHLQEYWSMEDSILMPASRYQDDEQERIAQLDQALTHSVQMRCLSDVPVGAFLSGGIDSSLIVALMQKVASHPVKTFSIGFDNPAYNEAPFAKKVAVHLGTEHYELYVSAQDALKVIPKLPLIYDEPFADASQIPTFLVSQFAKKHVTVVLSGDAGDELFGGYQRYFYYQKLNALMALPGFLKGAGAWLLQQMPHDKLRKLSELLRDSGKAPSVYELLISQNIDAHRYVKSEAQYLPLAKVGGLSTIEQMMLWDTQTYLPGDILTKIDRASMQVALETRVPFLDRKVFAFAWSLPLSEKVQGHQGKIVLRKLLARYVPREFFERPKVGFAVPLHDWLRGPLKEWAQDLLSDQALAQHGLLDQKLVQKAWQQHLHNEANLGYLLWNILMFQAWYRVYG